MCIWTKAKQLSNEVISDRTLFGDDSCVNFDEMTLESFRLWSAAALKVFLSVRKRGVQGSYEELVVAMQSYFYLLARIDI